MIAFGGAAPLHAYRLAEKLGIARVIIPHGAGVGSAIGFLRAPIAYEMVRSRYMRLDRFEPIAVNELLAAMSAESTAAARSAAGARELGEQRGAYMRYAGQGQEIHVILPNRDVREDDAGYFRVVFEEEYRRLFKRHIPDAAIEIMSWSVAVSTAKGSRTSIPPVAPVGQAQSSGERSVFDAHQAKEVSMRIVDRETLQPGEHIPGPAIVVEEGTSTLISSSFDAHVDGGGALILSLKGEQS